MRLWEQKESSVELTSSQQCFKWMILRFRRKLHWVFRAIVRRRDIDILLLAANKYVIIAYHMHQKKKMCAKVHLPVKERADPVDIFNRRSCKQSNDICS